MKTRLFTLKVLAAACTLIAAPVFSQVTLGPLEVWTPFKFTPTKPRLVVLLHGVTPEVYESPDQRIGKPGHARHYWGFRFIKGLQGESNVHNMNVITPAYFGVLRGRDTNVLDWFPGTSDTGGNDLAPICFPTNLGPITPAMAQSQSAMKSYINLMCGGTNTMVMINTRQGAKHLMPQLAETIEEVFMSYKIAFGSLPEARQPQIYLVGHSFGGVIARALLANPTAGDLWGNKLTANQRSMADYLRKRVVLVMTLAAPHEGTHIGDPAGDVADYITTYGPGIISNLLQEVNDWTSGHNYTAAEIKQMSKDFIQKGLNAVSGKRDCLQDLLRMNEYNAGILKPNVERRRPNGTLSDLVPIYTAAGRCPGGRYMDDDRGVFILQGLADNPYNPISAIDLITGTRFSSDAAALNLIEGVMHLYGYGREGKRPWGTAEAEIGDRFGGPFAGVGPASPRGLAGKWSPDDNLKTLAKMFFAGNPYVQFEADGEWDNDGFLGWDSANAYHLTGQNFYRLYDDALFGGNLPWDIDNHGSIMFSAANGAWIHNELIRQAGPLVKVGARTSVWNLADTPQTPSKHLKVEILEMKDRRQELDDASGADFQLTVRINGLTTVRNLPEGDTITEIAPFYHQGIPNTVIPIQISALELDTPDPFDVCVLSPEKHQSTLYLFYDTRTNKIMGDVRANGGEIFEVKPWWSTENTVDTKIRISQALPE